MYSLSDFENDIQKMKPRAFDTYALPVFLVWYAIKSTSMGRKVRRALFVSGVYMAYRSYSDYAALATYLRAIAARTLPADGGSGQGGTRDTLGDY